EQLPGPDLAAMDRWQECQFLFVRSPDADRGRAETAATVIVRRQTESKPVSLLLENDDRIEVQSTAAVLRRRRGIPPASTSELAAQLAPHQIQPIGVFVGRGPRLYARRDVVGQPLPDLGPEAFLLGRVCQAEVHSCPTSLRRD